jgi:hypothetical protein
MDETPAWMVCTNLLNKIKSELVTEAMEELDNQISKRNIDVKGTLITLPERPEETDMKMFIIRKLVSEVGKIRELYSDLAKSDSNDSKIVEQRERSRIFLLGVEKIVLLMHYESMIDSWSYDVGKMAGLNDAVEVMKGTLENPEREELIRFVLGSNKMIEEKVLSDDERDILERTILPK